MHDALAGERRVLLVQGDDRADELLVLQRLAQQPGAVHGLAVVGEAERAGLAQLGHLGQRLAVQAGGDAGHEADGDARLAPRGLAQAAQDRARSRRSGSCWASPRRRRSRRRPRSACRSRGPPCAPGPGRAGARAGRRSPGRRACRRRRSPRRRPAGRRRARRSCRSAMRTSRRSSIPLRGSRTWAPLIRTSAGGVSRWSSWLMRGSGSRWRAAARSGLRAARRGRPSGRPRRPRPAGRSRPAGSR